MFVKDIRREFYDVIVRKHVLVVSHCDVEAVCTFKILQSIIRCDNASYTLVAISTISALVDVIREQCKQIKFVILINCGANINLIEVLGVNDVTFFVLDSRRPFDLDNAYDSRQVYLLVDEQELKALELPKIDEIYRNDSSDEEENAQSDDEVLESPKTKRARRNKRLEKEQWIKKRNQLLFDYYEFSYYSTASSLLLFDLSWKLSRDNPDLLWYAAVGLTSQLLEGRINLAKYTLDSAEIQRHMSRHNHIMQSEAAFSVDCTKMVFEKDLMLVLYRHWTLLESLSHTIGTACHFKSWTLGGVKRLLNFLADLGLPLVECKQKFNANDVKLRKEAKEVIVKNVDRYKLSDLVFGSFACHSTYSHNFSASDVAYSLAALLHFHNVNNAKKSSLEQNYLNALDSFSRDYYEYSDLYAGIESYKLFTKVLVDEVQTFLNTGQIIPSASILQCVLSQGTPGLKYFVNSYCLHALGRFLSRAFVETPRGQKHKYKPLIIVVPIVDSDGMVLVAGIAPCFVQKECEKPVNFLGQAFQRISERTNCRMRQNSMDMSIVELKSEDRHRFCDALIALIEA